MKRAIVIGVAATLVVAGVLLLRGGGTDYYTVTTRLSNAAGLLDGSQVVLGGVPVGKARLVPNQDYVDLRLEIEPEYAPIDKNAKVTIIARNALGQKQVLIEARTGKADPAPDGYELPKSQLQSATDLDQLLGTLNADTRTRLAVLLNEGGLAFDGRKVDFKLLLSDLAPALSSGTDVLGQVTADNRSLRNLLTTSDRYVATLAQEKSKLSRMIDTLGRTTETIAGRRSELRETLRRAPAALVSARSFLAELRRTTGPLGATARRLTATAPPLLATLDEIEPFRRAAAPTLASATDVAPKLTRLATRTTPSLRRAMPALDTLQLALAKEFPAVGTALDHSMDNLLATLENWSRAIQFRDGLGHIFRGEAAFAPSFYERILSELGAPLQTRRSGRGDRRAPASPPPQAALQAPASAPTATPMLGDEIEGVTGPVLKPLLQQTTEQLDKLLGDVAQAGQPRVPEGAAPTALLDYLLKP